MALLAVACQRIGENVIRIYQVNPMCQIYPDLALYESCLDLKAETQYSFYDSLILAAAVRSGCEVLYTEDLQDGQDVIGVKIINPFQ